MNGEIRKKNEKEWIRPLAGPDQSTAKSKLKRALLIGGERKKKQQTVVKLSFILQRVGFLLIR